MDAKDNHIPIQMLRKSKSLKKLQVNQFNKCLTQMRQIHWMKQLKWTTIKILAVTPL